MLSLMDYIIILHLFRPDIFSYIMSLLIDINGLQRKLGRKF